MDLLLSDPVNYLDTAMLVFVRVLGLLLLTPVLSNRNVPYMVRVSFALFLTLIIVNVMPVKAGVASDNVLGFAVAVIMEFIVGFAIGFGAYMVYSILSLSGQFIDMQIGFSMVNVFDPMSQIQLTITGNLYYYVLILITIIVDAHHYFIRALLMSYRMIPLGAMTITPNLNDALIGYMSNYFKLALHIAAPVFFVILITNVVLGVLARAVPSLNMFVIGFPLKIAFGLFTIMIMLTAFSVISDNLIGESERQMRLIIEGMTPR